MNTAVTVRCDAYPYGRFTFSVAGRERGAETHTRETKSRLLFAPLRQGDLKSFGRLQAARNLLSRVKGFAEPLRGLCERLVFSPVVRLHGLLFPVSAARCGLVAAFDRHEDTEGKFPNDGKTEARPGNLTARDGNYAC